MATNALFKFATGFLVILFIGGMQACTYSPHYDTAHPHHHDPIGYYDYHYYPHVDVYFHIYTGHYYYRHKNQWIRTRVLPAHIHLGKGHRVLLNIRHIRPYDRHAEHREKYRPRGDYQYNRDTDRKEREYNAQRSREHRKKYETERFLRKRQ